MAGSVLTAGIRSTASLVRNAPISKALCSLVLLGSAFLGASALVAEDEWEAERLEFERQRDELRAMVAAPRDTGLYEVDFEALDFDRILLKDGDAFDRVYHYMTFRLRNRVSDNAEYLVKHASNFNEVMDSIVSEYESASFDTETGPRLKIENVETIEDLDLATIIDRPDLLVRTRKLNITVVASDEDGTRFRLFDPVYQGPLGRNDEPAWVFDDQRSRGGQEEFGFPNYGDARYGMAYREVREAIEEREGRRLLSVFDIRGRELAPYDPSVRNAEGVAQGEIYGVLIFDRLPVTGDEFTLHVQGLSNKLRFKGLEIKQGLPADPTKVQDYFNAEIMRRTFEVVVERPGDEFYLDQAPMEIVKAGWTWIEAFNRIQHKSTMAYAKFFLDNISLGEERDGPAGPELYNREVKAAFLEYWNQQTDVVSNRYQDDLVDVQLAIEETTERFESLQQEGVISEFMQIQYDLRLRHLQERQEALEQKIKALPGELANIRNQLEAADKAGE